ncbi:MAG: hypothetical protein IPM73_06590 [Betaproteobacteria bacterium]|nr:hypothetical protein [Betaproteobacteria bacterium]
MDQNLIYAKTPSGDEAVRQSTRVVQRNLRMVLVQVDGKLTVGELATKIGNPKMVEQSLSELEEGGFIAPVLEAASVWEEAKRKIAERAALAPASQFSTFGPREGAGPQSQPQASDSGSIPSVFSTFGRSAVPSETSDEDEEERSLIAKLSGALTISESAVEPARPLFASSRAWWWQALWGCWWPLSWRCSCFPTTAIGRMSKRRWLGLSSRPSRSTTSASACRRPPDSPSRG